MSAPDVDAIRAAILSAEGAARVDAEGRWIIPDGDAHLIGHAPLWLAELLEQNQRHANRIANMSHGLQALIDEHVTPRAQRLEVIHQLAQGIADAYGDQWPHDSGCQGDGLHGCPLCQILALSREGS